MTCTGHWPLIQPKSPPLPQDWVWGWKFQPLIPGGSLATGPILRDLPRVTSFTQ